MPILNLTMPLPLLQGKLATPGLYPRCRIFILHSLHQNSHILLQPIRSVIYPIPLHLSTGSFLAGGWIENPASSGGSLNVTMEEDYDTFQSSSARDDLTSIRKFSCSPSPEPSEPSQALGSGDSPSYEHVELTQSGPNGSPGDWEESGLIEDSMGSANDFSPISIGSPPPSSFGNLLSSDIDIPVATVAATQDLTSGGHPNRGNYEAGSSGSEYSGKSPALSFHHTASVRMLTIACRKPYSCFSALHEQHTVQRSLHLI
jgi:hypothetical protein